MAKGDIGKDHKPLSATKIGVKDKLPVMRGSFLRFPRAMREVARVSHLGCIKYCAVEGSMDYLEIDDGIGVFTDALGRHLLDEAADGPVNVEKGGHLPPEGMTVLHAAQIAWNSLARLERYLVDLEEKGFSVEEILHITPGPSPVVSSSSNPPGESEEVVNASRERQNLSPMVDTETPEALANFMLPPQFRREPEVQTMAYPGSDGLAQYSGYELAFDNVSEEELDKEDKQENAKKHVEDIEKAFTVESPVTVKSADVRKPVVYSHLPPIEPGERYLPAPHLPKRRSEREDEVGG